MVGRTSLMSCGIFIKLSANETGIPQRIGISSTTMRCAICAEGKHATVISSGVSPRAAGAISRFDRIAWCVISTILGSPVAPAVRYRIA